MSDLESLSHRSLSGVPMRPRAKQEPTDPARLMAAAVAELAHVLAQGQDRLANVLASVVTSKPAPEPSAPHSTSIDLTRGPDGRLSDGTVTCGERTWRIAFTRTAGGLSAEVISV